MGLLLLTACSSVDHALKDPASGALVSSLEPAPLRVGIAIRTETELAQGTAEDARPLPMPGSNNLQAALETAFRNQRMCSDVHWLTEFEASPQGWTALEGEDLDVVATLTLHPASYSYSGVSGRWPSTLGLWVLTWFGSLFVTDTEYEISMGMDAEIWDPITRERITASDLQAGSAKLSFFERNPVASKGFFASMLIPSFWTPDDEERLTESLAQRAAEHVAAGLKLTLLDQCKDLRACVVATPGTGYRSEGEEPEELRCEVLCEERVRSVRVFNNGVQLNWDLHMEIQSQTESTDGMHALRFRRDIRLAPGDNLLRIVVEPVSGQLATRTLKWTREG